MRAADYEIRIATPDDAPGITAVLKDITTERSHSAIDRPWPVEEQRSYLRSRSTRETFHVAVDAAGHIVAYQALDLYASALSSMAHVGQLGTFVRREFRGLGIGSSLFRATRTFAQTHGYLKFVIQVRASNSAAQTFYRRLGFTECGRLSRQVVIDGQPDDEILFELFL